MNSSEEPNFTTNAVIGNRELAEAVKIMATNMNDFFLVINAIIIFFMQCGFSFLEAGCVQGKSVVHTLLINYVEAFFSSIVYYLVGFGFAFGESNWFIGLKYFALHELQAERYSFWFFQFAFAATTCTIVSGAVVERVNFGLYSICMVIISGFIYPVVSHWVWDPTGWLAVGIDYGDEKVTFQDFAGSGVVHVTGGAAALAGAIVLGPRLQKKISKGKALLPYHNLPFVVLGAFILMFGFLSFNGASVASITEKGNGPTYAIAVINTMLAGSASGLTSLFLARVPAFGGKWSLMKTVNGSLAGMVAICSGCGYVAPWGALFIGFMAGFVYNMVSLAVSQLKIDDPLDAVAVHGGGGCWGLLGTAFCHQEKGIMYLANGASGLFLLWQILGFVMIAIWAGATSGAIFFTFKLIGVRPHEVEELRGLDYLTCGEVAYPFNSNFDGWVKGCDALGRFDLKMNDEDLAERNPNYRELNSAAVDKLAYRGERNSTNLI